MLHRIRRARDLFIPGIFAAIVVIAIVCVLAGCGSGAGSADAGTSYPTAAGVTAADGMATVAVGDLPDEARTTIGLIRSDGPFPYHQDGVVFHNREGLLPQKPSGYYHEYTVETPGSPDRGARRIVAARDGTMYYTDDHYESFRRISTS